MLSYKYLFFVVKVKFLSFAMLLFWELCGNSDV